ncbi:MAG: PhoH family protein [Treponema sp.]|nr:PhoH family protein [Treponema sp.]
MAYTIVVPDTELLQCVCGTNDSNLKLIEEHLGVEVFTRGNELSIESEDSDIQRQFNFVINRMMDEISDGNAYNPDMVASILNVETVDERPFRFNANSSIFIPGAVKKVFPKSQNQLELIESFRNYDMVFAEGPAGSGKTFLAVAVALELVLTHKKRGIVLTRPIVEAGESLGYLPGNLEDKINPYLRPLYDSMNSILTRDMVKRMVESEVIEMAPLAYMRGRTLNDSVIILDEAQNTTKEQMKMFLTRMGENSKIFVTGDITQIDLPSRIPSGLIDAMEVLKSVSDIKMIHMDSDDVVRNPLVKKIVQAYEYADNQ